MATRQIVFVLFLALTVLSFQVSARRLVDDVGGVPKRLQRTHGGIFDITKVPHRSQSIDYKSLEEIDRLKLSISKLICEALDEGCEHMDDAADHIGNSEHANESFANLNPHDHVKEYES